MCTNCFCYVLVESQVLFTDIYLQIHWMNLSISLKIAKNLCVNNIQNHKIFPFPFNLFWSKSTQKYVFNNFSFFFKFVNDCNELFQLNIIVIILYGITAICGSLIVMEIVEYIFISIIITYVCRRICINNQIQL